MQGHLQADLFSGVSTHYGDLSPWQSASPPISHTVYYGFHLQNHAPDGQEQGCCWYEKVYPTPKPCSSCLLPDLLRGKLGVCSACVVTCSVHTITQSTLHMAEPATTILDLMRRRSGYKAALQCSSPGPGYVADLTADYWIVGDEAKCSRLMSTSWPITVGGWACDASNKFIQMSIFYTELHCLRKNHEQQIGSLKKETINFKELEERIMSKDGPEQLQYDMSLQILIIN